MTWETSEEIMRNVLWASVAAAAAQAPSKPGGWFNLVGHCSGDEAACAR